jgi:hypothetical protein
MSLPSFPLTVPCPGAPFAPRGPSARFPRFVTTMARSDVPPAPLGFACARHPRFRLSTELTGTPKFLGDPRHACSGSSTPVESREQASGTMSLRVAPSMLPSELTASSASTTWIFRGPIPQPACSLSTLRDSGRPEHRARLASDWRPCLGRAGVQPAGSLHQVSALYGLTWHPPDRSFAWRTVSSPKPLPANNTPEQRNRPLRALCRAAPLPPVWHNVGHPWEA